MKPLFFKQSELLWIVFNKAKLCGNFTIKQLLVEIFQQICVTFLEILGQHSVNFYLIFPTKHYFVAKQHEHL